MEKTDKNSCYVDEKGNPCISDWYRPTPGFGMMYRRDALPWDHPEHIANCLKRLGFDPKDYGIDVPIVKAVYGCPECGHQMKLLDES